MTNIKDLAKMANVSVSTVSRVLNNHPYVKEEKRLAVLEAIKKCNYQQNINAVHLSKGKTQLRRRRSSFYRSSLFWTVVKRHCQSGP